jgi:CheY-like chemotaxis protein
MNRLLFGRRVLVVEDEMLVLMMIEMMLNELGCQTVVAASTVDTALTCLTEEDIDIAMLDINLGGIDSHPVASALDAMKVPYLFCTGNLTVDRRDQVSERLVLKKPFQFNALAAALGRLLAERDSGIRNA